MSIEVELPGVLDRQDLPMSPEKAGARISRRVPAAAIGALTMLLISGCSSKNPDSLIGSNLNENVVMMNAESNSEVGAAPANAAESNLSAAPPSAAASNQSSEARPPKRAVSSQSEPLPRSDENSISADTANEPTPDEGVGNAIANEDEVPNGV